MERSKNPHPWPAVLFVAVALLGSMTGDVVAQSPAVISSPRSYTVTDLGALSGGTESLAYGINSNGQVVGRSTSTLGTRAFLWTPGVGMRDLGGLPAGSSYAEAYSVNSSAQVVGAAYPHSTQAAFVWTAATGMNDIGYLTYSGNTFAAGINSGGVVVGQSGVFDPGWGAAAARAYRWTSAGGMQNLGALPGQHWSEARDINDSGVAAGYSSTSESGSNSHAVTWAPDGSLQDLGDLPGGVDQSFGWAINSAGQVVGVASASTGRRAFLWTPGVGMQNLGNITTPTTAHYAWDINASAEVVGTAASARAFVWNAKDGMRDLTDLLDQSGGGWIIVDARGINDQGQIVGLGYGPMSQHHAVLLTPTPEPALGSILVVTVMALGRRNRLAGL